MIKRLFRLMSSSKLVVTLIMKEGENIENVYILNPNVDGFMLVASSMNIFTQNKILIPRDNINTIRTQIISTNLGIERR
jgi:hypothetical protein